MAWAGKVSFRRTMRMTSTMMAAQLPVPEPWWGVLGAAGHWAWRNVWPERGVGDERGKVLDHANLGLARQA